MLRYRRINAEKRACSHLKGVLNDGLIEMPARSDKCFLDKPTWFCVRSKVKQEHIAAAYLFKGGVETFVPRIRFRRKTKNTAMWVTEALFPSYFFARLHPKHSIRLLEYSHGVIGVVHFGDHWPSIPDQVIQNLSVTMGGNNICTISDDITPGEEVKIIGGNFDGIQAVVQRVIPRKKRVAVLMDFLGRQSTVEIGFDSVVREANARQEVSILMFKD